MALRSLTEEVSELCIGKPELKWIAATATISDALAALKASGETYISVWECNADGSCACVGKFCTADVIFFLCRNRDLADPFEALQAPVYNILPKAAHIVRHAQPNSRFVFTNFPSFSVICLLICSIRDFFRFLFLYLHI